MDRIDHASIFKKVLKYTSACLASGLISFVPFYFIFSTTEEELKAYQAIIAKDQKIKTEYTSALPVFGDTIESVSQRMTNLAKRFDNPSILNINRYCMDKVTTKQGLNYSKAEKYFNCLKGEVPMANRKSPQDLRVIKSLGGSMLVASFATIVLISRRSRKEQFQPD